MCKECAPDLTCKSYTKTNNCLRFADCFDTAQSSTVRPIPAKPTVLLIGSLLAASVSFVCLLFTVGALLWMKYHKQQAAAENLIEMDNVAEQGIDNPALEDNFEDNFSID